MFVAVASGISGAVRRGLRRLVASGWERSAEAFLLTARAVGRTQSIGSWIDGTIPETTRVVVVGPAAAAAAAQHRVAPLRDRLFVVTRPRGEGLEAAARLRLLGAEVLFLPAIEIVPASDRRAIARALAGAARADWIVFTSRHAVRRFFDSAARAGTSARVLAGPRIAAVGRATSASLAAEGREPDLVPLVESAVGLVAAFRRVGGVRGRRILLPRSEVSRSTLAEGLRRLGAIVQDEAVYTVATPRPGAAARSVRRRLSGRGIDAFLLASGSAARGVLTLVGAIAARRRLAALAMGRETATAAREAGFRVEGVAGRPSEKALAALALERFGSAPAGTRRRRAKRRSSSQVEANSRSETL